MVLESTDAWTLTLLTNYNIKYCSPAASSSHLPSKPFTHQWGTIEVQQFLRGTNFKLGHFISTARLLSIRWESVGTSSTQTNVIWLCPDDTNSDSWCSSEFQSHKAVCKTLHVFNVLLCDRNVSLWKEAFHSKRLTDPIHSQCVLKNIKLETGILGALCCSPSGEWSFVKQISVSATGAMVFKNFPSRNWHSSVLYTSKQAGCVFPNQYFWASLMLRVADVVWY